VINIDQKLEKIDKIKQKIDHIKMKISPKQTKVKKRRKGRKQVKKLYESLSKARKQISNDVSINVASFESNVNFPKKLDKNKRKVTMNLNSLSTIKEDQVFKSTEISDNYIENKLVENLIIPKACYLKGTVRLNFDKSNNKTIKPKVYTYVETQVLIDTGCVGSAISKQLFDKLKEGETSQQFNKSDISIRSCNGNVDPIAGMTKVRLHFDPKTYVDLDVMISAKLTNDFILGYDFLGSEHVRKIRNNNIILNEKFYHKKVRIPLVIKEYLPLASYAISNAIIEPFEAAALLIDIRNIDYQWKKDESILFTLKKSKIKNLTFLNTVFTLKEDQTRFVLPVKNNSINPILLDQNQMIAEVDPLDNTSIQCNLLDINRMQLYDIKENIIDSNRLTVDADKLIEESNAFNDEEKAIAKVNLEKDGYFQPAVTDFIKDKSSITEIGLVDDKPLTEEEFLEQFDIAHLSKKHQNLSKKIFLRNWDAFAQHQYDIGITNMIEMNIPVTNDNPKMQKFIPIPFNAKEKVREILEQLKRYKIIRECNEPSNYCSNILVIKKRDGKSIRLLFDGRLLNYDTKRLPMATVSKPEILSHLYQKTHLTSLDFADAFFHIPLDKESQPLTAFYSSVHGQRFCFTRAPQGLRNSPLYLKLLLDKVFSDMADSCILFFDDLLIATNGSMEHHLRILDEVLRRIVQAGLKLRPKKICLAKDHVEFLGMVFQKGKISIPEAKLEAFRKFPSPNSPKKAKSLICALSFYRNFVPKFAELSREIMELSNVNPKQFKWTEVHETKLRTLIDAVCVNSQLYLPDPNKRFYVQTDSSTNCGGGRVYQYDEDGNEKIIAAVSRTYSRTERGYSIFKKEILALLYTLKTMDYFLRFADKLTILVDAKSIVYLKLAKDSSGILLRFSLELSKYNADICHVSGEENIVSDVLSRHHKDIVDILEENMTNKPLTEKESLVILKKLSFENGMPLTSEEVKNLLEGSSPTVVAKTTTKKSKAIQGNRYIKNTPATLVNKKLNLPQLSMKRPGVILPKRKRTTQNKLEGNDSKIKRQKVDINVTTRSSLKLVNDSENLDSMDTESIVENTVETQENLTNLNTDKPKNKRGRKKKAENVQNVQNDTIDSIQNKDISNASNHESLPNILPTEKQSDKNVQNIDTDVIFENLDEITDLENVISYTDIENVVNIIHDGIVSIKDFIKAQENDDFCIKVKNDANKKGYDNKPYELIHGVLFKIVSPTVKKPVLPEKLFEVILNVKHFSLYGAHSSASRIAREIKNNFFVPQNFLFKKLKEFIKTCYICQLYNDEIKGHFVSKLPKPNKPRVSWSMDIIPNMPKTEKGYSQILLCVDDFSCFVICIPIVDSTSKSIISALKNHIFMPFGIPQTIRSDEQISFYNSSEFYNFMSNHNVKLTPTSVAAPYSNSRAETSIKNIKKLARKFLFQENCIKEWDEYLSILTSTHNSSIGIYGYSAEQIMFATNTPKKSDILMFDWSLENEKDIVDKLFEKAENNRKNILEKMDLKAEQNRTYKNSTRIFKKFEIGALVLARQMQVSTGKGSGYKPKFTGPYIITSLNSDESTAFIEHIKTKHIIKAHFSNLQLLHYNPETLKYNHSLPEKLIYDLKIENLEKSKSKNNKKSSENESHE